MMANLQIKVFSEKFFRHVDRIFITSFSEPVFVRPCFFDSEPFMRYNEFDVIVEGKDINEGFRKGKLGYHDTDVMPWYAEQLSGYEQPFFSTLFTLSTHSPYDYPRLFEEIEWPVIEKSYVNSGYYTDMAIKMFMDKARQQDWYDSTLFVFVADHSHSSYKNHIMESFDHHKIPMLVYGFFT